LADHHDSAVAYTGSDGLQALTDDRMRMWSTFTNIIVGSVIFLVLLLVGMAVFLL
jgi:hypothetical protein